LGRGPASFGGSRKCTERHYRIGYGNCGKAYEDIRQAMGSAIVTNAHKINHGEYPVLKAAKTVTFSSLKKRTRKRL